MRNYDDDGTFDCTYGMDQVDIQIETDVGFLLQENGDLILQEGGGRIIV